MTNENQAVLDVQNIRKTYGRVEALREIDLRVAAGEFLTLLGASGSGKTTLLRIIAGFETPDSGRVSIRGADMTWASAAERQIGMVFQNYALFPHLTVLENVMFPLEMRRITRRAAADRARAALDSVHLGVFGDRYPRQLSGGQQQPSYGGFGACALPARRFAAMRWAHLPPVEQGPSAGAPEARGSRSVVLARRR